MRSTIIPHEAFPLTWPADVPRTRRPQRSQFKRMTCAAAVAEIRHELSFNARTIVISTNLPVRQDGLPMGSGAIQSSDHGVAVYWTEIVRNQSQPHVMTCDRWDQLAHNLHAIALSLAALRGLDRWGAVRREQAFAGFRALPAGTPPTRPWREVLEIDPILNEDRGFTPARLLELAHQQYRRLAAKHHVDRGGDPNLAVEINLAFDAACAELR